MSDPGEASLGPPQPPAPIPDRVDARPLARLDADAPPRSFASRLFGIGFGGWVQLILICIVLGAIFDAGGVNPFAPDFTISGALNAIGTGVVNIASWALQAGWRPFLIGALVVFPVWLVWRLITVPFRAKQSPLRNHRTLEREDL